MSETNETAAPAEAEPVQEPAQQPVQAPQDGGAPQEEAQAPSDSGTDEPGSSEQTSAEEDEPAAPEVVSDDSGQHVNMPDGTVVTTRSHTYPVSNAEQDVYEQTHSGDQLRYPYKPGDREYSPYSDPSVPDSRLSQMIEREIVSFADRVATDGKALISPIWSGLQPTYKAEIEAAVETGGGEGKVRA
jgi:hypothetical protein